MAASALEEKINKIKLQNEEIKRRHEEVEADKKNAAKLNALVQMVPSSDWPERKEPPEFSKKEIIKSSSKPKTVKEHSERPHQYLIGEAEGKKTHKFVQGDGPPPDPKYNFLADSERDENNLESKRNEEKLKGTNKHRRNGPRRRGGGRDGYQKDHRDLQAVSRDESLLEYDAWRAERNLIDEARISRQRTAEGNWRREWDSDKLNMEKDSSKKDTRFLVNDMNRQDYKEFERRHQFDGEHSNLGRAGSHRNSFGSKNTHDHYDIQHYNHSNEYSKAPVKGTLSPIDDRTVIATDKSIKVTIIQGANPVKGPVMSVKVNAPTIAGTGRVGPRQKTRVTYSSQSEVEKSAHKIDNSSRRKSFDDKVHFSNAQRIISPKSPYAPRKKENSPKSPYPQRKDTKRDEQSVRPQKHGENISKSPCLQKKEFKDPQKSPKPQRHSNTSAAYGSISPRARVQNRLNEAKNTVIKILAQTCDNNENAIKQSEEIAADKCVEEDGDKIIHGREFLGENSQCEEITKDKEMIEEIEKVDIFPNMRRELVNVLSREEINNKTIKNRSDDLLKLEEKVSEKSNEIPSNINVTESGCNLKNQIL